MQHEGSNGVTVKERILSQGKILNCYGENLAFHCETAEDILSQLVIDDGVKERGHRENIFNRDFKVVGCYCGPHRDFEYMCCLDFCGQLVKKGEKDPIEEQMQQFLKEQVEFEMPPDVRSWKQNTKVHVQGNKATKTITRTCILKDGSQHPLTKTLTREFTL